MNPGNFNPSRKDNHTDLASRLSDSNQQASSPAQPQSDNQQVRASDGSMVTLGQKPSKTK